MNSVPRSGENGKPDTADKAGGRTPFAGDQRPHRQGPRLKGLYRNVYTCIWGDATFRQFSQDAKLLWIYLTTGPHTSPVEGLISIREAVLADGLKWRVKDLRKSWAEIEVADWGKADWDAGVAWLPSLLAEDKPCSPKNILGWKWELPNIPECPLRTEACEAIVARCLERAAEVASKSQNPMNILAEWRAAIAKSFGGIIDTSRHGDDAPSHGAWHARCNAGIGIGKGKGKRTPPQPPAKAKRNAEGIQLLLGKETKTVMGPRTRRMLTNWRGTTMNPLSPCIADAAPRRSRRGSGTASPATASARLRSPTRNGSMPARRNPRSVRRRIPSTAPASRRSTSSSGIPHPSRLPRPSVESHPQLVEATARLLAFYRQTVGSPYSEDGADAAIMALLAGGTTEKRLTGAIRRYARDCDKQRLDNTARKGAPAFFASAWQEYAPAESPPLQPYEPRAVLSDEEFAARPGLARKSALVDEHFSKHLVGDDRRGRPDSFIARILLDGVPPIELLAAAQGYARHAAKEALPQNERILSPEFFVAEWQRWRTHPPDCWATELADELAKSEAQLAEELAAAMSKHELRIAKRSEMTRPQPTSVPARPVAQAEPPT